MERNEAIRRIRLLTGQDLVPLADRYHVTIWKSPGKKNKGWAGHVIERYLGLPINSAQSPNFGSWELKVVPLKRVSGRIAVKETMAITMIDEYNVKRTVFEDSHLLTKLMKQVIAARVWINQQETSSLLYAVKTFDLSNLEIYNQVKSDYELVRNTIIEQGFSALTGKMGVYIQPRTKGAGHGSTSRAFYARVPFLKKIFLISKSQV